jgi:hypothetical protein
MQQKKKKTVSLSSLPTSDLAKNIKSIISLQRVLSVDSTRCLPSSGKKNRYLKGGRGGTKRKMRLRGKRARKDLCLDNRGAEINCS